MGRDLQDCIPYPGRIMGIVGELACLRTSNRRIGDGCAERRLHSDIDIQLNISNHLHRTDIVFLIHVNYHERIMKLHRRMSLWGHTR